MSDDLNPSSAAAHPAGLRLVDDGEPPPWLDDPPLPEEPPDPDTPQGAQSSKTDELVELARRSAAEFWATPHDEAFVSVRTKRGIEHLPVRSAAFGRWLRGTAFSAGAATSSSSSLADAVAQLEAEALFGGAAQHKVHRRVAGDDRVVWIALEPGRVVRVDAGGWRIMSADNPEVPRFRWGPQMAALPEPVGGRSLRFELQSVANVPDGEWPKIATWAVSALRPCSTYVILGVEGEQGCGKTSLSRILARIVDPADVPLRRPPRTEQDLAIAAKSRWALCFDNVSTLRPDLSDALCGLSTGSGLASRKLYSDDEEVVLQLCNPALLNGIAGLGARPDLLDRMLVVQLPTISDGTRRPQSELDAAIAVALPGIFGALLDALSVAIRRLDEVTARWGELPRMADPALWALAAAPALGVVEDELHAALMATTDEQQLAAVAEDPVGSLLLGHGEPGQRWEGTSSQLLGKLRAWGGDDERKGLPGRAAELGKKLRRLAPGLRREGCEVRLLKRGRVDITWAANCSHRSHRSQTSSCGPRDSDAGGHGAPERLQPPSRHAERVGSGHGSVEHVQAADAPAHAQDGVGAPPTMPSASSASDASNFHEGENGAGELL